tara:strand:- start:92 stop:670 length:579 start_codon:yes stop_codon:yes gene_type:complete
MGMERSLAPRPLAVVTLLLVVPGAASLHIVFGAHNIPHPAKAGKGGEDAFFFDDGIGTFGLADGVGGTARNGVDPGKFSREVLWRCQQSVAIGEGEKVPKLTDVVEMATAVPMTLGGSTTLILGQMEESTDTLSLLNLGDSGAMLLRPALRKFGDMQVLVPRCVLRSMDQSHFFVSSAKCPPTCRLAFCVSH